MKLTFCVACGSKDDLQHHHLVTRAEGGDDDEANLITLCASCHDKLHERQTNGTYNHSERTKAALAAAKARGVRLGNPKGRDTFGDEVRERAHARSAEVRHAKALARAKALAPTIGKLRASGITSANGIANALNEQGVTTAQGKCWTARAVINVEQFVRGLS